MAVESVGSTGRRCSPHDRYLGCLADTSFCPSPAARSGDDLLHAILLVLGPAARTAWISLWMSLGERLGARCAGLGCAWDRGGRVVSDPAEDYVNDLIEDAKLVASYGTRSGLASSIKSFT